MNLKVVTPDGVVWNAEVDFVNLKTTLGEITVLPKHIPLITTLEFGMVRVRSDGRDFRAECSGGVLEVKKDSQAIIITEHCSKFLAEE